MSSAPLLFQYNVIAEYIGMNIYPFKSGDRAEGLLTFNLDTDVVKLAVSVQDKPLDFIYSMWSSFRLEWKIINRS